MSFPLSRRGRFGRVSGFDTMPQLLLLIAAGAGLLMVKRYLKKQQERVASDLRAAKEAMGRQGVDHTVPLEQDPTTGVYRPKQMR